MTQKKLSLHQKTVRALRQIALESQVGELIGSEDDLLARLNVSRPTLRQAAAHVAQENLIMVRRGANGGYFAIQPSSAMVSRMAGIYLHTQKATLSELLEAAEPLRAEVVKLAAVSCDEATAIELKHLLTNDDSDAGSGYRDFLREERRLGKVLGELCSNRVVELLLQIVYDLAARINPDEDVYRNHPERIQEYRTQRNRMIRAILENDVEYAELMSRRCSRLVAGWVADDLAGNERELHIVNAE